MGYTNISIYTDPLEGELLVAEGEKKKGGAYIARITGLDTKFKYARQFISRREYAGRKKDIVVAKVSTSELQNPDILEIRAGGSWKNDYRDFYLYENGKLTKIDENEMRKKLAEVLSKKQVAIPFR